MNSISIFLCFLIGTGICIALRSILKKKGSGHCQSCPHEEECPFRKLKQ